MPDVDTHWAVIVPDAIGAFGVVVAGSAAWLSQRGSSKSIDVSRTVAVIELDRRDAERVPRLSARLECWGTGQEGFALSVWLETAEPLARIRVVVQEARNMDSPLGFKPGQEGVETWTEPGFYQANGFLPGWQSDGLIPLAERRERMAPGTAAVWLMELRSTVQMSAGTDGVRFKALAWAERDDLRWEIPLPVTLTNNAIDRIAQKAGQSGR